MSQTSDSKALTAVVKVDISPGELLDKITILQIKSERIEDQDKNRNVMIELEVLETAFSQSLTMSDKMSELTASLKQVNQALWDIENDIRACERAQDFGPEFIKLARAVYQTNDRRAALKAEINELCGSDLREEKSYADYD